MEYFNFLGLIIFFFDKIIKVVIKIVYFFIIVLVFWFVNDNLNFIYFYRIFDKLEYIEKINVIINNDLIFNFI